MSTIIKAIPNQANHFDLNGDYLPKNYKPELDAEAKVQLINSYNEDDVYNLGEIYEITIGTTKFQFTFTEQTNQIWYVQSDTSHLTNSDSPYLILEGSASSPTSFKRGDWIGLGSGNNQFVVRVLEELAEWSRFSSWGSPLTARVIQSSVTAGATSILLNSATPFTSNEIHLNDRVRFGSSLAGVERVVTSLSLANDPDYDQTRVTFETPLTASEVTRITSNLTISVENREYGYQVYIDRPLTSSQVTILQNHRNVYKWDEEVNGVTDQKRHLNLISLLTFNKASSGSGGGSSYDDTALRTLINQRLTEAQGDARYDRQTGLKKITGAVYHGSGSRITLNGDSDLNKLHILETGEVTTVNIDFEPTSDLDVIALSNPDGSGGTIQVQILGTDTVTLDECETATFVWENTETSIWVCYSLFKVGGDSELPTLPSAGSRNDKILRFDGDTLGWEDLASGATPSNNPITATKVGNNLTLSSGNTTGPSLSSLTDAFVIVVKFTRGSTNQSMSGIITKSEINNSASNYRFIIQGSGSAHFPIFTSGGNLILGTFDNGGITELTSSGYPVVMVFNLEGVLSASEKERLLPTLPSAGSRNEKIARFQNDTLVWENFTSPNYTVTERYVVFKAASGVANADVPSGSETKTNRQVALEAPSIQPNSEVKVIYVQVGIDDGTFGGDATLYFPLADLVANNELTTQTLTQTSQFPDGESIEITNIIVRNHSGGRGSTNLKVYSLKIAYSEHNNGYLIFYFQLLNNARNDAGANITVHYTLYGFSL